MFHKLQTLREKKVWNGKIMVGEPHTSVGLEETLSMLGGAMELVVETR